MNDETQRPTDLVAWFFGRGGRIIHTPVEGRVCITLVLGDYMFSIRLGKTQKLPDPYTDVEVQLLLEALYKITTHE
jgi:hypothetical protein